MDHWPAVLGVARVALLYSDDAPEVRRRVSRMRNSLVNAGEHEEAGDLTALLDKAAPGGLKRAVGDDPAPETVAKLKADTLDALYRWGTITEEQRQGGRDIAEVYEALCAGFLPQAVDLDMGGIHAGPGSRFAAGLERMPRRLYGLWKWRWGPWVEELGKGRVAYRAGRYGHLELMIDVLWEGRSLHELERSLGLRNGALTPPFVEGLERWCRIEPRRASRKRS